MTSLHASSSRRPNHPIPSSDTKQRSQNIKFRQQQRQRSHTVSNSSPIISANHAMTTQDWASHFWITLVDEEGESERILHEMIALSWRSLNARLTDLFFGSPLVPAIQPSLPIRRPGKENGQFHLALSSCHALPTESGTSCGVTSISSLTITIPSRTRRLGTSPMDSLFP